MTQRGGVINRIFKIGLALSAVCFLVAVQGSSLHGQGNSGGNNGQSEVQRGFDIAPVLLDLAGKNRSLVGLGSYYVNGVSDCVGCHSPDPARYFCGGAQFGPVFSRNLTPDAAGRPAGLTPEQFKEVLRFGTDFTDLFLPGRSLSSTRRWLPSTGLSRADMLARASPGDPVRRRRTRQ